MTIKITGQSAIEGNHITTPQIHSRKIPSNSPETPPRAARLDGLIPAYIYITTGKAAPVCYLP